MGEDLLYGLAAENHSPSTVLSMDRPANADGGAGSGGDGRREMLFHSASSFARAHAALSFSPPDINLPFFTGISCEFLASQLSDAAVDVVPVPAKPGSRKAVKRSDSIWGAWFFFSFYFKPVLSDKCRGRAVLDAAAGGVPGFDRSDIRNDIFLVQHDMENLYMWAFKERPENALGKMQLRSFMNGHSRPGEPQFPFSVDRGFLRSHRMQRKHYRGLSNPQCIHGIEIVMSPDLSAVPEADRKRWIELTGRSLNFTIPKEASDFASWRNTHAVAELDGRHPGGAKRPQNGSNLNLSPSSNSGGDDGMDASPVSSSKRRHPSDDASSLQPTSSNEIKSPDVAETQHPAEPSWVGEFSGVMRQACGPVTAAKTIYEDDDGYLIMVSLPLVDQQRVKVTWKNGPSHGIVKIQCVSTARAPSVRRRGRVFRLADPWPEHCPPGDFVREIALPARIPEDAKMEAYFDEGGAVLEIVVPKRPSEPEEHEVRVCVRPRSL